MDVVVISLEPSGSLRRVLSRQEVVLTFQAVALYDQSLDSGTPSPPVKCQDWSKEPELLGCSRGAGSRGARGSMSVL